MAASLRKIIHIDMDAFYASVEQRDHPELKGKPLAVGGDGKRGVVAAASYEARKYGVYSAMSSKIALQKCPHLIFVRPRFEEYKKVSLQIREIFSEYTDLIEPLSLDEAYLDVTHNKKQFPSATLLARQIKEEIKTKTNLTASAGISFNKFLAKIASDFNKPNGLFTIVPADASKFIDELPIKKFHGIGKVTAKKMHKLGIYTGEDLKKWKKNDLLKHFGKVGGFYYHIARGEDSRPVNPNRTRKSIGAERTFSEDLLEEQQMLEALEKITQKLSSILIEKNIKGRTVTLKVKYSDFKQITRSQTSIEDIQTKEDFTKVYVALLKSIFPLRKGVRLLGLQVSNLSSQEMSSKVGMQLTLSF
ncbi:DNA polymerase IV [Bernardetia sp.]|uniref:DNA polymerase IV n=1 Tax=Bernardetia sp. TaxID=1937974 RepID=UPI0025BE323A|nr:DNA polymerase IV [Bernardetia sp.]